MTATVLERPALGGVPEHHHTTEDQNGPLSHIVWLPPGSDDETPQAYVLRARIEGFPVTALCGYTWNPTRDPAQYPTCQVCKDAFEYDPNGFGDRGELPDA